jgi:hypothetical protein
MTWQKIACWDLVKPTGRLLIWKTEIGSAKLFLIFLFMRHVCTIHPSVHNGRVITVVNPLAPRNITVL